MVDATTYYHYDQLVAEAQSRLTGAEKSNRLQAINLAAENGDIPAGVRHAMRMLCDYVYSQQRGSSAEANEIPQSIYTILKLYRNFQ